MSDLYRKFMNVPIQSPPDHSVRPPDDRKYLLDVGDGPEGIRIYTSEDRGVVDWAESFPAVYLEVSTFHTFHKVGPFALPNIYRQLLQALKPSSLPGEQDDQTVENATPGQTGPETGPEADDDVPWWL